MRIALYILADFVMPVVVFAALYIAVRSLRKTVDKMMKEMLHLHALMGILSSGVPDSTRLFFDRVKKAGPDCDMTKMCNEQNLEVFGGAKERLLRMLKEETDPVQKHKLERMLQELEGMYNLVSTMDENSSKEYRKSVFDNLEASVRKIAEDFGEE